MGSTMSWIGWSFLVFLVIVILLVVGVGLYVYRDDLKLPENIESKPTA